MITFPGERNENVKLCTEMAPVKKGFHGYHCEKNRNAAILTDYIVPNKSAVAMVDN